LYSIKKEDILNGLNEFNKYTSNLKEDGNLMPVVFVGHGSPMNGIEDNEFSIYWSQLARQIPLPKAVLVVSAHWLSRGTKVTAMDFPPTIHDFGGFPQALFDVQYPAPGSLEIAKETSAIIRLADVELDHDWGLDHGAWTVVRHMYPEANIPVLQLSIDHTKSPQYHYDLARELYELRKRGVLIMGSGNMVHNLRMVAWNRLSDGEYGYDWALEINEKFKSLITNGDHQALINYSSISPDIDKAIPTSEHYIPLLYTLGLQGKQDEVSFFNDKAVGGSLTMTSVMLG
jgi:4,5-DOPA dioxygenase extradiol